MTRTPARVTQADVARCIRAARQTGAGAVEVRPDGTLLIHIADVHKAGISPDPEEKQLEDGEEAIL